ncbi:hypothetical protein VZT92_016490 [Zoarces viviparus]|uniref:Uncharacterized protein n=1 Tax=Zoarces viviparus TaxID=48416 RepID=A0AAW1EUA7_ZOAVI
MVSNTVSLPSIRFLWREIPNTLQSSSVANSTPKPIMLTTSPPSSKSIIPGLCFQDSPPSSCHSPECNRFIQKPESLEPVVSF